MNFKYFSKHILLIAFGSGVIIGLLDYGAFLSVTKFIAHVFTRFLKLISLPLIGLSVVSTISKLEKGAQFLKLTRKILFYTVITTLLAASLALGLYTVLAPVKTKIPLNTELSGFHFNTYFDKAMEIIPDNIVASYLGGNVIGIILFSALLGFAILSLKEEERTLLSNFFSYLFSAILQITQWVVKIIPLAIFAFTANFLSELGAHGLEWKELGLYLTCILSSNLIHGGVVLPLLLIFHKISPYQLFKDMRHALSIAFFTKSSVAALPSAIECAEIKAGLSSRVTRFSFPLCTTINMNGCAAFILITVLFVCENHGVSFSLFEKLTWIFISTLAAIGNAGIPMGCFFLSGAILSAMNVPVDYMGMILPFYAFLDMLETGINVWSDGCVTAIVDRHHLSE